MCEPKFKVGNRVTWGDEACTVTDGPFAGATFPDPAKFYDKGFLYVVQPDCSAAQLIHESRLTRAEQWEPCPGKHRTGGPNTCIYDHMERRVE